MNQPEIIDQSRSLSVDRGPLRKAVNADVDHRVADGLQDSIALAVEEIFKAGIQLVTDAVVAQNKSTIYGPTGVLISRLIEGGLSDSYLETCLNNIA